MKLNRSINSGGMDFRNQSLSWDLYAAFLSFRYMYKIKQMKKIRISDIQKNSDRNFTVLVTFFHLFRFFDHCENCEVFF